jgi:RHS repeat-associated protein
VVGTEPKNADLAKRSCRCHTRYDALGRRISKTVGPDVTVFYYDNARIIETQETGGSGSVTTYTYGNYIDEVLTATRPAPLGTLYYHQNTLWSFHALTDAAGAVVERYTYDAYGAPQILTSAFGPLTSSAFGNRFMFTGREWDTECSLYHYRARTYGPGLGRFYSRDPLGYVDGMNLYGYVRGMPMSYADPLGLRMVTVGCTGYSGTLSVWVEGFTEEEEITLFGSVCSALRTLKAVNDALWNHEYVRPWTSAHTFTNTQLNRHLYDRQSGPLLNSVVERLRGKYVDLISEITDQPDGIKYECGFNSGPCANPNIPMYKMGGVDWNIYVCKSCFSLPQKDITGTLIHDLSHMYLQTSDYTTPFTDGIYLTGYTQQGIPIYETLMLEGSLSNYPSNMFGVEKRLQHADTISHFALMWYLPP